MGVNSKHIATFLLGAAAAFAAKKYSDLSPEEKEKLAANLKAKAHDLKADAETAADKAKDYFTELKSKGGEALKEYLTDAEDLIHNLFNAPEKKV